MTSSAFARGLANGQFFIAGRRVDVAANVVEWRGQSVHLEPRVMELLVYLAACGGRVVSRAELESEVWAGSVVGYDAVTQTVSKLRKALGDDPRNHCVLETVAKRGYRLIAPVEPDLPKSVSEADADPSVTQGVVGGSITPKARASPRIWAAAALSLALAVLVVWHLWGVDSDERSLPEPPSLAVLPFGNLSGEPALDVSGEAFTDSVTRVLAAEPALQIVVRRSAFGEEDAETDPTILARRLGARYLVGGSVERDGADLGIDVRLTDTATNRQLWAKHYVSPVENLFSVVGDISLHVGSALLPSRVTPAAAPEVESVPEPDSGLSYSAWVDSPKRLKCLYGNAAQMSGDHATAAYIFADCIERWSDVRSMIALAHILELGVGVPQDLPRAALLLQRGANSQDVEGYSSLARYHYGMALLQGRGIAPDGVKGLEWLRRAATEGVEDARVYLARYFPEQLPENYVVGGSVAP